MEDQSPQVPPSQPEPEVKIPQKPSVAGKLLIPILIVIILVLAGTTVFLLGRPTVSPNSTQPQLQPTEVLQPTTAETISDISQWKTYTSDEAGFSLKYPDSVLLEVETRAATQPVLRISAEKLSDIPEDLPSLMGRNGALKQKAELAKGEEATFRIGPLYGKLGMNLSQFEICSVIFFRSLTFYPGDYRVIISLAGPKEEIMDSMPEFFTVDSANCGDERIWNQDKISTFEQTLKQKNGGEEGQKWYDTFDEIIKTITLTTPSNNAPSPSATAPSDWSTYKNEKYGFEISYPKSYKILEGKKDLYGYPKGIALLYTGGQAYDIVIEVWNTQLEYKSQYASRLSDVTVVNYQDKFITLLDNTLSQENKEIISSFKLSP